jgi:ATP-binding protein involved in chromosome partitioning
VTSQADAESVRQALRAVYDPELGANLVDLNMVRRVDVMGDHAEIGLVLSVPDCPLADWIVDQVRQAALSVPGIATASVRILDEPWVAPGQSARWREWMYQRRGY